MYFVFYFCVSTFSAEVLERYSECIADLNTSIQKAGNLMYLVKVCPVERTIQTICVNIQQQQLQLRATTG